MVDRIIGWAFKPKSLSKVDVRDALTVTKEELVISVHYLSLKQIILFIFIIKQIHLQFCNQVVMIIGYYQNDNWNIWVEHFISKQGAADLLAN